MRFSAFANLNHERVVAEASAVYGDEKAVKKAVMKYPAFVGLNHERVVAEAAKVYGDEEAVKKAVMKFPQFASYDHERVVREAAAVYGDGGTVKRVVMKHPVFASYDHERVVREASAVYGDEAAVKKALVKYPAFVGLNHERVLKEKIHIGEVIGLTKEKIISMILERPLLAGYSAKRYLAALDIGRTLEKEGFTPDREMFRIFMKNVMKSPYVPGFRRKRVSHCPPGSPEPQLLKTMRKRLEKLQN